MAPALAPVAADHEHALYALREGALRFTEALDDPALQDCHALEVLGHTMIGLEKVDPGGTALELSKYARVAHGTLVKQLTNTQRALLTLYAV